MTAMPKQAIWPIGFIVGAVATSLVLGFFEVGGIVRLLLVIAGGIGTGFLSEQVAKKES
jgi:hypothetical protein